MSENEKLSQDEVNALMEGIDNFNVDTSNSTEKKEYPVFDFAAQERIVSGRLPALFGIVERFVRNFRMSLMNLLRRTVEINLEDLDTLKYSEYISNLKTPACMCLVRMRPLHGATIIYFNSKLVFRLVDWLFGCSPHYRSSISDVKEFTQMELRIVNLVLSLIFKDAKEAWKPIISIEFEHTGVEFNPQLLNIATQSDILIVMKFKVDIDGEISEIHHVIPYSVIEPIRTNLETMNQGEQAEINDVWNTLLKEETFSAKVPLTGNLAQVKLKLKDVLNIKNGDVLPIEMSESITVLAAGLPTFRAKFGVSNGKYSIKITGRASRDYLEK